jgi:hypothetical protein
MTAADPNKGRAALLPSIVYGLIAGALFSLLATAASRSTITTLSGNGALVILFGGCGAALAGGWFALADKTRGNPAWLTRALLAALATVVLELAFGFAPVLLSNALQNAGAQLILIGLLVVLALSTGIALAGGGQRAGQITALVALLPTLPTFGLSYLLLPLLLPLTMAMPALSLARTMWLAANCIALLLALLVGVFASQTLTNR